MSIVTRLDEGLTAPVDAGALRQIVLNLLDNSVKYGPTAQTVSVSAMLHGNDARIVVEDEGPGVGAEEIDRIWQSFYRGAGAQATGGAGIGLTIVKQLVDLHKGRVWFERRELAGARFIVELPQAAVAGETLEWPSAAASA